MTERIAVVGLGHAGALLSLALARKFADVVCFGSDVDQVYPYCSDAQRKQLTHALRSARLRITDRADDLAGRTFFVIAPSPTATPDLAPLERACMTVGQALSKGAVVVIGATVYPGVTEDICGPILERESGLKRGVDFWLGYSPERANPGDADHVLERVPRIVSGEDSQTLERVFAVYAAIIDAGVHRAPTIKVAEAAKVIENTQRDLNIALMNELAIMFDRMGIRTSDVLEAASTKWNVPDFKPGLPGGPGIGADSQYLSMKAQQLGYQPEVILAGRRINDSMGAYVAQKLVKLLIDTDVTLRTARVGILGLAFKEDYADCVNSKVPGVYHELRQFGIEAKVHDPLVSPADAIRECGIQLSAIDEMVDLDALVLTVRHSAYVAMLPSRLNGMLRDGGIVVDVKSFVDPAELKSSARYWSL